MFKNLQNIFDGVTEFPIEIQDICDALVQMGYQDDIRVVPRAMDTQNLRGAFYQWTEAGGQPYADPIWVSLVVYPEGTPVLEQRVICAKELVHVCDNNALKNSDPDEVKVLAGAVCNTIPRANLPSVTSIKVAKDNLAQAQALTLLFPKAARIIARKKIAAGEIALGDLEEIFQVPQSILEDMLDERWEEIAGELAHF